MQLEENLVPGFSVVECSVPCSTGLWLDFAQLNRPYWSSAIQHQIRKSLSLKTYLKLVLGYAGLSLFHLRAETANGHSRNSTGKVHQAIRNKKDKTLALLLALISFVFRAHIQGSKEASSYRLCTACLDGLCPMSVEVLLDYW